MPAAANAQGAPGELHARADAALQSFLIKYWNGSYLSATYPGGGGSRTGYWTFAQGFDALLDGVERTGGARYAGLIETFYQAQERSGWINPWFDDMNWMALALLRAHDLTGEPRYLDRAVALFDRIIGAWDETCCGAEPGGIWWNAAHSQKATASNAGPVITAVRLANRLGNDAYLDFARQVYDYWFEQMVDRSRWHVWDHINPDGTRVDWQFSYNEGLMIGAATELWLATGEERFRQEARNIAGFLTTSVVRSTPLGDVLSDGSSSSCGGDCHAFKGVAYRYLALLDSVASLPSARAVLDASGDAIWDLARNTEQTLFAVDWGGPPMSFHSEPQSAAAVMALNIHAYRRERFPGVDAPPGRYEAEDATIDGLLLAADLSGFTGWGYASGFDRSGDGIRFRVDAPADGSYDVSIRYAAAAAASRHILIDGAVAHADRTFPATSAGSAFGDVTLRVEWSSGPHVIEIRYESFGGNSGSIQAIDHLQLLEPPARFLRGDCNSDGLADISDAVSTLAQLFLGAPAATCGDACDANDDGAIDISDAVATLGALFLGDAPLPAPGAQNCGVDPTDDGLGCDETSATCADD